MRRGRLAGLRPGRRPSDRKKNRAWAHDEEEEERGGGQEEGVGRREEARGISGSRRPRVPQRRPRRLSLLPRALERRLSPPSLSARRSCQAPGGQLALASAGGLLLPSSGALHDSATVPHATASVRRRASRHCPRGLKAFPWLRGQPPPPPLAWQLGRGSC
jgi:hypothetical protein